MEVGNCVYIIKTSKRLYKIGKTKNLQKRIASYHTHLPILFKVVRQYMAENNDHLEEALHVVFQHKRIKGEWFELSNDQLTICDNIARNYGFTELNRTKKPDMKIEFSDNPLLQVMEANAKYLNEYDRVVKDIKIGLNTEEIIELHQGGVNKITIQTIRKILEYQTPNSELINEWIFIVNDLQEKLTTSEIVDKYKGKVNRSLIQTIKRILKNQLY